MNIAKTSTPAFQQSDKLTILHNIAQKLTSLCIIRNCTAWNIHNLAFTIGTGTFIDTAILPITGEDVTLIFKVQQCPVVAVTTKDNIATLTSITTIGSTVGYIFCTMKVRHTTASTTRTAHNLYIIDKI